MCTSISGLGAAITIAAILLVGCAPKESAPLQAQQLTQEETDRMFDEATSVEAVGEPMVRATVVGDITVTTTSQLMMLEDPRGGTAPVLAICSGQCKVTVPGGTLGQCKVHGCAPKGKTCTPIECSGSCSLDKECKREPVIKFTDSIL